MDKNLETRQQGSTPCLLLQIFKEKKEKRLKVQRLSKILVNESRVGKIQFIYSLL